MSGDVHYYMWQSRCHLPSVQKAWRLDEMLLVAMYDRKTGKCDRLQGFTLQAVAVSLRSIVQVQYKPRSIGRKIICEEA